MTNLGLSTSRGVAAPPAAPFRHEALLYEGSAGFVRVTVPFLRDAMTGGEPVLAMVERRRIDRLRSAMGRHTPGIHFLDVTSVGRNPACIIPAWQDFVSAHAAPGVRLRGIGEPVWAGRGPEEIVECQRHEALLGTAFADATPFWLVCLYDAQALDRDVIDQVDHTHRVVGEPDGRTRRAHPRHEGVTTGGLASTLPEPPRGHLVLRVDADLLPSLRGLVIPAAREAGLRRPRTHDLLLAVVEVVHNSVEHGGGECVLRLWQAAGAVVCEMRDSGHITDPLVGRRRPPADAERGRGLWLVNHLCDLVQLRSSPAGTVVRLHMWP